MKKLFLVLRGLVLLFFRKIMQIRFGYLMRKASVVVYEMISTEWELTDDLIDRVLKSDDTRIKSYLNSSTYRGIVQINTHHVAKSESARKASVSFLIRHLLISERVETKISGFQKDWIAQSAIKNQEVVFSPRYQMRLANKIRGVKEYIKKAKPKLTLVKN